MVCIRYISRSFWLTRLVIESWSCSFAQEFEVCRDEVKSPLDC